MGVSRIKLLKNNDRKAAVVNSGANVAKAEVPSPGMSNSTQAKLAENDQFNKHYNKELKVAEGKLGICD